jgi:hypothetical protein
MYTEPLTYPEIIHNFSILKSTFNLFDYRCPDCSDSLVNDIIYVKSEIQITFNSYNQGAFVEWDGDFVFREYITG